MTTNNNRPVEEVAEMLFAEITTYIANAHPESDLGRDPGGWTGTDRAGYHVRLRTPDVTPGALRRAVTLLVRRGKLERHPRNRRAVRVIA